MRLIVMFDLLQTTSAERSLYARFRKNLIQQGFMMMQESIYCKLVMNPIAAGFAKQGVDRIKPGKGLIQVLVITEKQYASIDYILGEPPQKQISSTDRLVII